mmetsp:Transcript_6028/g.12060  ORF Transcript_6028/g.12060 Transcript_6028/m.12060 type:complete len:363 (+) Transcript_6028:27-1115(+)
MKTIISTPQNPALNRLDDVVVTVSSLLMVAVSSIPALLMARIAKRVKERIKRRRERKDKSEDEGNDKGGGLKEEVAYWAKRGAAVAACVMLYRAIMNSRASHRYRKFFKNLPFWNSFFRYVDFTIVDASEPGRRQVTPFEQKVLAIVPHGLMPYPLALAALSPEAERTAFGRFRVVAATAARFVLPGLALFIRSIDGVDASRASVDAAMGEGQSIAVSPGGIDEMFINYPSEGWSKHEEGAVLANRKGFLRLCLKHSVPVVPIFCFGASNMMRRVNVPGAEALSKVLKASIILIYGRMGFPVPFRTNLRYVMGNPIWPVEGMDEEVNVEGMHEAFTEEIHRIFEEHKEIYEKSWEGKELRIV